MGTAALGQSRALEIVPDPDPAARDAFVLGHPDGTIFHLSAWHRAVRSAFGHEILDLVALRNGRVEGVLPLACAKSLLFGRRMVSAAFGVYGGPLATDPEVGRRLVAAAAKQAEERRVDSLELRLRGCVERPDDWASRDLHVTFLGPIAGTDEELLRSIPKETRRGVRRGLEEGFRPEVGHERLGDFHRLFARSYRDLGTPVFPMRWIRALIAELGDRAILFSLTDGEGGPVVAATLAFRFRDEIAPYYVGADRDCYRRNVNHVLYYELMRYGRETGHATFDFGRSKRGTGSFDFKKRWGLEQVPIRSCYYLVRDTTVPDLTPLNPRYARRIALWKKLPLAIANRLGPRIVRNLP